MGYTFWLENQLHNKKVATLYWWIIALNKCCNGAFVFRFLLTWYQKVGEQGPYISGVYTPKLQYRWCLYSKIAVSVVFRFQNLSRVICHLFFKEIAYLLPHVRFSTSGFKIYSYKYFWLDCGHICANSCWYACSLNFWKEWMKSSSELLQMGSLL